MLYQPIPYILMCTCEQTVSFLVITFTQLEYNELLYYPDIATITFLYIRALTKIGQCFQFATKRFLETYIISNKQINAMGRIM